MEHGNFEGKSHSKDLKLARTIKAPRELVFEAFTQARHLVHWWAPKPFTVPSCKVDLRVGGSWRYVFRSPEGLEHKCEAVYREVAPPGKLVMEQAVPGEDGQPLFRIRQTVNLVQKGEITELDMAVKVLFVKAGSEPFLGGMEQGTNMTLDNLVSYLAKG